MTALRLAAEQPERVSRLVIAGGFAHRVLDDAAARAAEGTIARMRAHWAAYIDEFFTICFTEPHSSKAYEDGVLHNGWASDGETVAMGYAGWFGADTRALATAVRCPTLVMHGDQDRRVPYSMGEEIARLVPGAQLLTVAGGGHLTAARDPVFFGRTVR
jgi:pimeloyl-ACP methyl ester carboxylesterase